MGESNRQKKRQKEREKKEGGIVIIECFVYIDEVPGTASSSYKY